MKTTPFAFCALVAAAPLAAAETVRLPATADNSIVLVDGEWHLNQGRLPRIRIKGNQHIVAMAFDLAAARGRRVASAELVCAAGDAQIEGLTVSTIGAEWDERESSSLASGRRPYEGWAWPGSRFPDVSGGNGGSILCQAPSVRAGGLYRWRIDPDLVHAMAVGAAHGLALHEWSVDYSRNPTICSREQNGREPFLEVTLADAPGPPPEPPAALRVYDTGERDGLRLELRAPARGFAYEVEVDGHPLPRWNVPFARPGERQVVALRDVSLPASGPVSVAVRALDRVGQRSEAATARGTVAARRPAPRFELPPLPPAAAGAGGWRVLPLVDRFAADGSPVGELPAGYETRNEVFDGARVRLRAAAGEVVGFQALLPAADVAAAACRIGTWRVDLGRAVHVATPRGRVPDPVVPAGAAQPPPAPGEAVPLVVEVYVPFDAPPGPVAGELALADGRRLPVEIGVRPFALPRRAAFACEMNSYGMPDRVAEFLRLERVAYDHRAHANLLHYGHRTAAPGARKCSRDMVLPDGRRMDERRYNDLAPGAAGGWWDDFVAAFDGYLSGAARADGHRGAVAPPGFYLTFHESWPLNVRAFWDGRMDAYEAFAARPEYARTFQAVLRDFVALAERRGWTNAGFQVYLNNKGEPGDPQKNPWILDEPASYWDYRALAFYADLVRAARGTGSPVRVDFRIDISRPQFDRGQLAGKADLWVVSGGAFREYRRMVLDRAERTGERIWVYGAASPVEASARETEAWVLDAYRRGASGVVPWQTIDRDGSALAKADPLGLFVFEAAGDADGVRVHPTIRLKAFREAEQLVAYLELARARNGWTRAELEDFLDAHAPAAEDSPRTGPEDEAPTARYARASPESFRRLREAAARAIESAPRAHTSQSVSPSRGGAHSP